MSVVCTLYRGRPHIEPQMDYILPRKSIIVWTKWKYFAEAPPGLLPTIYLWWSQWAQKWLKVLHTYSSGSLSQSSALEQSAISVQCSAVQCSAVHMSAALFHVAWRVWTIVTTIARAKDWALDWIGLFLPPPHSQHNGVTQPYNLHYPVHCALHCAAVCSLNCVLCSVYSKPQVFQRTATVWTLAALLLGEPPVGS